MKGGITATKTSKAANSANSLWPMLNSTELLGTQTFSRTRRKSTDKCRRVRLRKLIRISACCFERQNAIRFRGIGHDRVTAVKTLQKRRQKSNDY
jgi:hypothetical protein